MYTAATVPSGKVQVSSQRILSIDFLRGIVMFIMALDHVRDYINRDAFLFNPLDASKTNAAFYFTRWITHFCAPTFVLLSGLSAYLYGKNKSRKQLFIFLFTRGVWLLFAELVILSFAWSFTPVPYAMMFVVVSAIGVSMMILSLLIFLPDSFILCFGLILIFGHNLLDNVHFNNGDSPTLLWSLLHQFGIFTWGNNYHFEVYYPLVPWTGVMAVGYYLGRFFTNDVSFKKRKSVLRITGLTAILLFILLRYLNVYGDPVHWQAGATMTQTVMMFLNVSKYPPSLLFLLITLGPVLLLLSFLRDDAVSATNPFVVLGSVPFFYYVVHIYLIHLVAVVVALSQGHPFSDMVNNTFVPESGKLNDGSYGLSLFWTYIIWLGIVAAVYPLCRWYANFRRVHKDWKWLSYF